MRYAKKLLLDSEEFESRPFVRVTRHTSTICPSPIRPMPGDSWKTTKIRDLRKKDPHNIIVTAISGAPPEKWEAESYTKEALPSRQHRKSKNKPRRPRPFRLSSIKNENSPNCTSAAEICVDWGRAARAACAARDPACACSLRWWRARSLRRSPTRGAATRTREHRLCVFFFTSTTPANPANPARSEPSQPSQEPAQPSQPCPARQSM